jgi:S1-C subfamily serine protease
MSMNDNDLDGADDLAPVSPPVKRSNPIIAIAIAVAAVLVIGGLGTAAVAVVTSPTTSASSTSTGSSFGLITPGQRQFGQVQGGNSVGRQAISGQTTASVATPATAAQQVGVVVIDTTLDYTAGYQAAGTGMILSSNGLVLTNNHVIESSTSIKVTVESTGKTYTAQVVGSDTTADVAVLQLVGASGLSTVKFAPSESVTVGESVYSVGNAEGTGSLVTATGTVGAINQSLTVGSDSSDASESLTGLIELNSDVVSGDSGGPLFDKSGNVIGIVTAASSGTAQVTGYAINIAQVLTVVNQIEAGKASSTITIGYPAFLGVDIASTTSAIGVPVQNAIAGMPAAAVGIVAGDVITAVNGTPMTTPAQLSATITSYKVGQRVTITWQTQAGATQSAVVTLAAGPAA